MVAVDDEDRENEGDLIIAAEHMTPEKMAFMIRYTSGVICLPMEGDRLDELNIPLMVMGNENTEVPAHRVHGLSRLPRRHHHGHLCSRPQHDGARTASIRASRAGDFARPGHIFPLRYRDGGVLKRAGHTEAAVDLARLAGRYPAGVLVGDRQRRRHDGSASRDLEAFAAEHGLVLITIADLIRYRRRAREARAARRRRRASPPHFGDFTAHVFESISTTSSTSRS